VGCAGYARRTGSGASVLGDRVPAARSAVGAVVGSDDTDSRDLAEASPSFHRLTDPMHITRRFTVAGQDPFDAFPFTPRTARIVNPDGSVVFELKDLHVPEHWSQVAVDILAQKYFRKAGVPLRAERVPEAGVPEWLQRSRPADGSALGQETDARQVFRRLAG